MSKKKKTLKNNKPKPKKTVDKRTEETFNDDGLDPEVVAIFDEWIRNAPPSHNITAERYYAFQKDDKEEDYEYIYMTWLIVGEERAYVQHLPMRGTHELNLLTAREKRIPLFYGNGFRLVPKFVEEVILIVDDLTDDKKFVNKILNRIIYKKDDKLYYVDDTGERNVIEISSGEKFPRSLLFDDNGNLKAGVIEYNNPAVWSISLTYESNDNSKCYLVPACNLKDFAPKRWLEDIFYRDIDETEYRTSNFFWPPANLNQPFDEFSNVDTFAIYMGELFPHDKGSALLSDDFAVKAFNEHFSDKMHKITEMIGCVVLCCPYLCKRAAQVVSREYIDALIERRGCETIVFRRDDLNATVARDLQEAISQGGGKYKDKLVVVTDKNFDADIDYLMDLTAFDNPADLRRRSNLNVFGMSKHSFDAEDNVTFDKSFVARLCKIDFGKGEALVDKIASDYAQKRIDELNPDRPPTAPSSADFKNNPKKAMLKSLGVRRYAQMFPDEYKEMVDELQKELKALEKSHAFPTLGIECIALVDPAKNFGVDILNADGDCVEALCVFAEQEKISACVGSFPHEDKAADLLKIKFLRVEEYIERLNECRALNERLKEILTGHIRRSSEGVIILPAQAIRANTVKLYFREEIIKFVWIGK